MTKAKTTIALWLHYIPLALISLGVVNLVAHLFGKHTVHTTIFNIILFIALYVGLSLSDMLIHTIFKTMGIKD